MSLIEQLKWLGEPEEVAFEKKKFRGKLAGKSWKYSQYLNGLIRTRALVFIMALLVLYPILTNYLYFDFFSMGLFIERVIYSIMLLTFGFFFNKYRLLAIAAASLVLILILYGYLSVGHFDIKKIGFIGAVLFFMLLGLYQHVSLVKIKKELEANLLENALIDDVK